MVRAASAAVSLRASDPERSASRFAADVAFYLNQTPRQLPSRYLYDALGSSLFDAICHLPWYRITRAETGMLARHGSDILAAVHPLARIVELGSGNGEKLAVLLETRRRTRTPLQVHLVDLSRAALETAAHAVGAFPGVTVVAHHATYEDGLDAAVRSAQTGSQGAGSPKRVARRRTLALFLGSNIGNFDPPAAEALLRQVAASLAPADAFLLGADLVKPERDLLLAYDDPLGVTAAFNMNLLVRINRELGADFDIGSFRHRAVWNAARSRVEMHLVSLRPQRVRVPAAGVDLTLRAGETIWTESSYKYRAPEVLRTLERCGFRRRVQWVDDDARFAVTLVDRA
ncbi:MAG TPA: L-histidine N(alpha)-methyltransferase [Vicinamibacterales bacterium]|nr:L-histidine N(alpha)-methyltransferase [Vicinamibacterales bacterium]